MVSDLSSEIRVKHHPRPLRYFCWKPDQARRENANIWRQIFLLPIHDEAHQLRSRKMESIASDREKHRNTLRQYRERKQILEGR